jgi:hypothetical protein
MFSEGHLAKTVARIIDGGEVTIDVRWRLCADAKMVCLVTGLGGPTGADLAPNACGSG